jgi:nitrite reductase/ring-hydroxylating ferredoxin subunit/uncharacterized membrane protein
VGDTALETIADQSWLQPIADPLSTAVRQTYEAAGETGQQIKNAMHGVWLGHPLHPALTDVPLGAWTTALVFDTAEVATNDLAYGRAADIAVGVGVAGAVGAAVTGLTDWSETDGRAKRLGLVHGLLNLSATALYVTSLAMRRKGDRHLGRVYGAAGFAVASAAAYLGGGLVYRERIGVTHVDEGGPKEFTRALAASDLPDNARRLGDADGTPVMVARQHGTLCALAEHCSHLGGPLSEGTLKDGSIVCPWHGSEFALRDGSVINGPATHPQPCFDVRERASAVEVRVR